MDTFSNESIFCKQPEAEYTAQSVTCRFSEENPEFVLDKFGALSETKEFYVKDSYFGRGAEENKRSIDRLENLSGAIKVFLLAEEFVSLYAEEYGLKILTISFQSGKQPLSHPEAPPAPNAAYHENRPVSRWFSWYVFSVSGLSDWITGWAGP